MRNRNRDETNESVPVTNENGQHLRQGDNFGHRHNDERGHRFAQGSNSKLGGGRGRNLGGSFGTGGYCACAKCGEKLPHQRGVKCTTVKCPKCGHTMVREELLNPI